MPMNFCNIVTICYSSKIVGSTKHTILPLWILLNWEFQNNVSHLTLRKYCCEIMYQHQGTPFVFRAINLLIFTDFHHLPHPPHGGICPWPRPIPQPPRLELPSRICPCPIAAQWTGTAWWILLPKPLIRTMRPLLSIWKLRKEPIRPQKRPKKQIKGMQMLIW